MSGLHRCHECKAWTTSFHFECDECNGTNARYSYDHQTANLASNIAAAAVEEMRVRMAYARMMATWGYVLKEARMRNARC